MPGTGKRIAIIQKDGRFLTYTRNCKQKATIGIVKSVHLRYLPDITASYPSKSKVTQLLCKVVWGQVLFILCQIL